MSTHSDSTNVKRHGILAKHSTSRKRCQRIPDHFTSIQNVLSKSLLRSKEQLKTIEALSQDWKPLHQISSSTNNIVPRKRNPEKIDVDKTLDELSNKVKCITKEIELLYVKPRKEMPGYCTKPENRMKSKQVKAPLLGTSTISQQDRKNETLHKLLKVSEINSTSTSKHHLHLGFKPNVTNNETTANRGNISEVHRNDTELLEKLKNFTVLENEKNKVTSQIPLAENKSTPLPIFLGTNVTQNVSVELNKMPKNSTINKELSAGTTGSTEVPMNSTLNQTRSTNMLNDTRATTRYMVVETPQTVMSLQTRAKNDTNNAPKNSTNNGKTTWRNIPATKSQGTASSNEPLTTMAHSRKTTVKTEPVTELNKAIENVTNTSKRPSDVYARPVNVNTSHPNHRGSHCLTWDSLVPQLRSLIGSHSTTNIRQDIMPSSSTRGSAAGPSSSLDIPWSDEFSCTGPFMEMEECYVGNCPGECALANICNIMLPFSGACGLKMRNGC